MKSTFALVLFLGGFAISPAFAETPALLIRRSGDQLELSWPGVRVAPDGAWSRPMFELQRSSDLRDWSPWGERLRAAATDQPQDLLHSLAGTLEPEVTSRFFRLLTLEPIPPAALASGGAEVFGYGAAFAEALAGIGQISPEQFAARYPTTNEYLPGLTWNPLTAQFWSAFAADIGEVNRDKEPGQPGFRFFDTRLRPEELAVFATNGFVVSERLGGDSFGQQFYDLWHNDLPVFVSTDALLHAWHRTYDELLQEVEETFLFHSVETLLDSMAGQVAAADQKIGSGVLRDSLRDADWFLAVARSLLAGTNAPPSPTVLGDNARVAETLQDIRQEQLKPVANFMGFCRMVDFSQFKIRGHYARSERMGRYFQCVMWLGRIDVPVAGGPFKRCPNEDPRLTSPRETGLAIVFGDLLRESGAFPVWADLERVLSAFVGWTDSLNFGQLSGVLAAAGIRSLADVRDVATLERVQADLVHGELGVQNIRSDWFEAPLGGGARYGLPQTFTLFGQKFVPDSWALSQSVFSSILRVENGETNAVNRRVPGALDVAFATLGNDQVVPELVAQMTGQFVDSGRPHALKWRDAQPYQHNLAAARTVMDQQTSESRSGSIYQGWIDTLRQLSPATTAPTFPETMRTRAWARKTLNTQLASWTQLRHDTLLYSKPSYSSFSECVYPTGYVEPRREFWRHLAETVRSAAELIRGLSYSGTYTFVPKWPPGAEDPETGSLLLVDPETGATSAPEAEYTVELRRVQDRQVHHLQSFAAVVERLELLTAKELDQQCFNDDDRQFLDGLMENRRRVGACGGPVEFSGWYPNLFYRPIYWVGDRAFDANYGAAAYPGLVADIHTDVPTDYEPGSVLHEAVGRVNLLMMAVDNGGDRFVCAGPVLSHYEFEVLGSPRRLSDEEWIHLLRNQMFPEDTSAANFEGLTPPPWTRSYLVPQPTE